MTFQRLFIIYILMVFSVSVFLIAGEALFFVKFKRRKNFVIRLILSLLGYFAFSVAVFSIHIATSQTNVGNVLMYMSLFIATLFAGVICFDESPWRILFSGCAGYATQHLTYKLYSIFTLTIITDTYLTLILQTFFYAAIYAIIFFVFAKRANLNATYGFGSRGAIVFSLFTLVIAVVLNNLIDYYLGDNVPINIILSCFSILCCLVILFLHSGILEHSRIKRDLNTVQNLLIKEKSQYALSKENIDIINIKCHDLKHQLQMLRNQPETVTNDSLKEIEDAILIYDSSINTGSETLDILLMEKSLFCNKQDIKLSCMADGKALSFMSPSDIYSLFGNILENAIEAVIKLKDTDLRVISLVVKADKGFLLIQVDNFFQGSIQLENGLPITTKEDIRYHGFGTKSIKMLTDKYNGYLSVNHEDDVFRLQVKIPLPDAFST